MKTEHSIFTSTNIPQCPENCPKSLVLQHNFRLKQRTTVMYFHAEQKDVESNGTIFSRYILSENIQETNRTKWKLTQRVHNSATPIQYSSNMCLLLLFPVQVHVHLKVNQLTIQNKTKCIKRNGNNNPML